MKQFEFCIMMITLDCHPKRQSSNPNNVIFIIFFLCEISELLIYLTTLVVE